MRHEPFRVTIDGANYDDHGEMRINCFGCFCRQEKLDHNVVVVRKSYQRSHNALDMPFELHTFTRDSGMIQVAAHDVAEMYLVEPRKIVRVNEEELPGYLKYNARTGRMSLEGVFSEEFPLSLGGSHRDLFWRLIVLGRHARETSRERFILELVKTYHHAVDILSEFDSDYVLRVLLEGWGATQSAEQDKLDMREQVEAGTEILQGMVGPTRKVKDRKGREREVNTDLRDQFQTGGTVKASAIRTFDDICEALETFAEISSQYGVPFNVMKK